MVRVWVCACAATGKKEKLKNEGTFMTWKKVIWEENIFYRIWFKMGSPESQISSKKNLISVTTNEKTFHQIFLTKKNLFWTQTIIDSFLIKSTFLGSQKLLPFSFLTKDLFAEGQKKIDLV